MEERIINGKKYHYSCDIDGLCKEDGYPFTMEDLHQELDKAREEGIFTKEELELILDGLETKHDEYSGVIDLTKYDKVADKVSKLLKEEE